MTADVTMPVVLHHGEVVSSRLRDHRQAVSGDGSDDLVARMRQALAGAQQTNRALEIECERLRQRVRASEAERSPAAHQHFVAIGNGPLKPLGEQQATSLNSSRETSFLHQVAELTQSVADWQAKYGRVATQLEAVDLRNQAQARRIQEQDVVVKRLNAIISDLVGHEP